MNRFIIIACIATLLIAAVTGVFFYNLGLAQAGNVDFDRHWHPFFFPFFLGPLIFLFVISALVRGMFGGYYYRGRRFARRCGDFEEWHREMHERMWNDPKNEGAQPR